MFSLITKTEQRNSIVFPVSDAQIWKCHLRKIHLFEPARRTTEIILCVLVACLLVKDTLREIYHADIVVQPPTNLYEVQRERERESEREEGTERETK